MNTFGTLPDDVHHVTFERLESSGPFSGPISTRVFVHLKFLCVLHTVDMLIANKDMCEMPYMLDMKRSRAPGQYLDNIAAHSGFVSLKTTSRCL